MTVIPTIFVQFKLVSQPYIVPASCQASMSTGVDKFWSNHFFETVWNRLKFKFALDNQTPRGGRFPVFWWTNEKKTGLRGGRWTHLNACCVVFRAQATACARGISQVYVKKMCCVFFLRFFFCFHKFDCIYWFFFCACLFAVCVFALLFPSVLCFFLLIPGSACYSSIECTLVCCSYFLLRFLALCGFL